MSVVMEISDHVVVLEYGARSPTARPSTCATTQGHRRLPRRRGRGGGEGGSGDRDVTGRVRDGDSGAGVTPGHIPCLSER
jgi:hypothetical protein